MDNLDDMLESQLQETQEIPKNRRPRPQTQAKSGWGMSMDPATQNNQQQVDFLQQQQAAQQAVNKHELAESRNEPEIPVIPDLDDGEDDDITKQVGFPEIADSQESELENDARG